MASGRSTGRRDERDGAAADDGGRRECMPCAGRGTLISRLGGDLHPVKCPWCEGSGQRREGIDAQAHWGGEDDAADAGAPDEPVSSDAES